MHWRLLEQWVSLVNGPISKPELRAQTRRSKGHLWSCASPSFTLQPCTASRPELTTQETESQCLDMIAANPRGEAFRPIQVHRKSQFGELELRWMPTQYCKGTREGNFVPVIHHGLWPVYFATLRWHTARGHRLCLERSPKQSPGQRCSAPLLGSMRSGRPVFSVCSDGQTASSQLPAPSSELQVEGPFTSANDQVGLLASCNTGSRAPRWKNTDFWTCPSSRS